MTNGCKNRIYTPLTFNIGIRPVTAGAGPKTGGPHYLSRFITEKTRSNNITAIGGNTSLLSLGD